MARPARVAGFCLPLLALAACGAITPRGVTREDIARYAAASIGCVMAREADYLPVERQAGLTRRQSLKIGSWLLKAGKAEPLPGGGIRLTAGACA